MTVLPGADPFAADGSRTGVLVLHGFTGSPVSMRPWAEHLAAAGLTVRLPRLPGHGTRWQDLNVTGWRDWYGAAEQAFDDLRGRCDEVFVCGLSMGGTLALRLAEVRARELAGVVVVNASLNTEDRRAALLPLLSRVIASLPPIGNDVNRPGVDEGAYDRLPLKAAVSLRELWATVRADLPSITAPILAFRSAEDHVVPASSLRILTRGATGTTVTERVLTNSFHVATLDHDAPTIFAESVAFIRAQAEVQA
ncbi:MAG TPA: alpha/beta fold hydrolase [Mycobacteriales bacterium]|nr:alpha/beta fold hydrolase [Mycobacteriales bacterium]